jgi:hypothetical protein
VNLVDVADQLGDRLDLIEGLNVYRNPPGSVTPPAAVVGYPEDYEYLEELDRMTLPVVLVVGKASLESARAELAAYVKKNGDRSVKGTLESGAYTALDTVRVTGAEFDSVRIGGTDYLAAVFDLDITGSGAE